MKDCEALLEGKTKVSVKPLQIGGLADIAVLKLLTGDRHKDMRCPIRKLTLDELSAIPAFNKPLVEEKLQKRLALFSLLAGGTFLAWKAADHAGNAEWITEKLTKALQDLSTAF